MIKHQFSDVPDGDWYDAAELNPLLARVVAVLQACLPKDHTMLCAEVNAHELLPQPCDCLLGKAQRLLAELKELQK